MHQQIHLSGNSCSMSYGNKLENTTISGEKKKQLGDEYRSYDLLNFNKICDMCNDQAWARAPPPSHAPSFS